MLDRIFPSHVDNRYRGHVMGLWLFVPITLQRFAMSFTHLFKADGGAQSLSNIPLDSYPPSAAQNIIGMFARLGLEQLLLASLLLLVLVRYRALIPLMYLIVIAQYFGGQLVAGIKPLARAGTSGVGTPLLVIAILCIIGLVLSLVGKGYTQRKPG